MMKRIVIVGPGGAGKSTLARTLGKRLHIPVHHLDKLYWKDNWVKTPHEEWLEIQNGLMEESAWILDGNFSKSFDERFAAADTIIFLDLPRTLLVWRVIKRIFLNWRKMRPDMGGNNVERFDLSFLLWIWNYPSREVEEKLEALQKSKVVLIFKKSKEVSIFLRSI